MVGGYLALCKHFAMRKKTPTAEEEAPAAVKSVADCLPLLSAALAKAAAAKGERAEEVVISSPTPSQDRPAASVRELSDSLRRARDLADRCLEESFGLADDDGIQECFQLDRRRRKRRHRRVNRRFERDVDEAIAAVTSDSQPQPLPVVDASKAVDLNAEVVVAHTPAPAQPPIETDNLFLQSYYNPPARLIFPFKEEPPDENGGSDSEDSVVCVADLRRPSPADDLADAVAGMDLEEEDDDDYDEEQEERRDAVAGGEQGSADDSRPVVNCRQQTEVSRSEGKGGELEVEVGRFYGESRLDRSRRRRRELRKRKKKNEIQEDSTAEKEKLARQGDEVHSDSDYGSGTSSVSPSSPPALPLVEGGKRRRRSDVSESNESESEAILSPPVKMIKRKRSLDPREKNIFQLDGGNVLLHHE